MNRNKGYEIVPLLLKRKLIVLFGDMDKNHPFRRDYRSWDNCVRVCAVILFKQYDCTDEGCPASLYYCGLASEYWKKVIGSHYQRYIGFLISNGVIERKKGNYEVDNKIYRIFGYRIHPDLNNGEYVVIKYKGGNYIQAEEIINKIQGREIIKNLEFDPGEITLKKKLAEKWIQENAEQFVLSDISEKYYDGLPDKLSLAFTKLDTKGAQKTHYFSVEAGRRIAKDEQLSMFHYRGRNIIADKTKFINDRVLNFKEHYSRSVRTLAPEIFNFSRHKNTRRVYSQLVSLPSSLLQFVRIHNQFIMQADLKCSQFTIFANLVNAYLNRNTQYGIDLLKVFNNRKSRQFIQNLFKVLDQHKDSLPNVGINPNVPVEDILAEDNDVIKFLQDVFFHDFYSMLRSNLGLQTRAHAKLWAFTIVFGKPRTNNVIKQQMSSLYPTVIKIIDDFKLTYESNQFAVGLQILEAELFIDNIWKTAKKQKITSFTRHDSLLYAVSKNKEVKIIIQDTKEKFKFIGEFFYKTFNDEEIEQQMIENTDFIDYDIDIDMLDINTHFPDPENPFKDFSEFNLETLSMLLDIGIQDDYHGLIGDELMERIIQLPLIQGERVISFLEDEVWNIRQGYGFFQYETNDIIREIVSLLISMEKQITVL